MGVRYGAGRAGALAPREIVTHARTGDVESAWISMLLIRQGRVWQARQSCR
jgi:hypothetical protein